MSKVPEGVEGDELLLASRSILIDAIFLLQDHDAGVTVVGAQAVYLRSPSVFLGVAPTTSDADIVLNPQLIANEPEISELMEGASFELLDKDQPGLWSRQVQFAGGLAPVGVDLLVPAAFAGEGKRAARMPPHERKTARRVPGLEAAIVDRDRLTIAGFADDGRSVEAWVAGPAALLVAKAYKLAERLGQVDHRPDRLADKDATDVVRLMVAWDPDDVLERWEALDAAQEQIASVAELGRKYLLEVFGGRDAPGLEMARRNLAGTGTDVVRVVQPWMQMFRTE